MTQVILIVRALSDIKHYLAFSLWKISSVFDRYLSDLNPWVLKHNVALIEKLIIKITKLKAEILSNWNCFPNLSLQLGQRSTIIWRPRKKMTRMMKTFNVEIRQFSSCSHRFSKVSEIWHKHRGSPCWPWSSSCWAMEASSHCLYKKNFELIVCTALF